MSLARHGGLSGSFLDVCAGTGPATQVLAQVFPEAHVEGIEPVAELREQPQRIHGIDSSRLHEGDALNLPFVDDSFDRLAETRVLHHIRDWRRAVAEMARVTRCGVLTSDTNTIGVGSAEARKLKTIIKKLGCWDLYIWLQTKGKMSKYSEGDGVYYSCCAFDALPFLLRKFGQVHAINTNGIGEGDLLGAVTHVAILARRKEAPTAAA
jgi:ubiquinone/menaquinone biosynthesis C-methylase UbiE